MGPVNNIAGGSIGRSRLVDLLLRSGGRTNNGTTAGGLAHVVNSGMRGLMAGRELSRQETERQQETDAMNAMNRGMAAKPWQPPEGETLYSGPGADAPEISREQFMQQQPAAGGYDGALTALQGLGGANPSAGRLTQQLMFRKAERDQTLADRAADQDWQRSMYELRRAGQIEDRNADQAHDVELLNARLSAEAGKPGRGMWAHDRENGSVTMVDEATIRANPERFGPQSEAADPKYMSRRRPLGNQEVFEVSFDGGRSWSVEGEPYPRGADPTAALLASILGGGGLVDGEGAAPSAPVQAGGNPAPMPGPAPAAGGPSPADIEATLQAARAAIQNGRDRASVVQQLQQAGIDPGRL